MEPDKTNTRRTNPATTTHEDIDSDVEEVSMLCGEGKIDEGIEQGEAMLENSFDDDRIGLSPLDKLRLHLVLSNYYEDPEYAELHFIEAHILWSFLKQAYASDNRPDIDNYLGILYEELQGIAAVLGQQLEDLKGDEDYGLLGYSEEDDELEGSQDGEELQSSQEDDNEAKSETDVPRLIEHAEEGLRQLDLSSGQDIAPQTQHGTSLGQMTGMESLPSGMHGRTASSSTSLVSDTAIMTSPSPTLPIGEESTSPIPNVETGLMDRALQAEARIDQLNLRIAELEEQAVQAAARNGQLNLRVLGLEERSQQDIANLITERQYQVAQNQRHAQERARYAQQQARDAAIIAELQKRLQDHTAL